MDKRLGLSVLYTDQNGVQSPATINKLNDDGTVNLLIFTSSPGDRLPDQMNVNYSETLSANTWSNV